MPPLSRIDSRASRGNPSVEKIATPPGPDLALKALARSKIPSTFPTPNQVRLWLERSNEARLITTPRVPFKIQWQRSSNETGDSWAYSASVAVALLATPAAF